MPAVAPAPFHARSALIVLGLGGLVVYHLATQNFALALNDALTIVAATHYGPVLTFLAQLGFRVPPDPAVAPGPAVAVDPAAPSHPVSTF